MIETQQSKLTRVGAGDNHTRVSQMSPRFWTRDSVIDLRTPIRMQPKTFLRAAPTTENREESGPGGKADWPSDGVPPSARAQQLQLLGASVQASSMRPAVSAGGRAPKGGQECGAPTLEQRFGKTLQGSAFLKVFPEGVPEGGATVAGTSHGAHSRWDIHMQLLESI